MTGSETPSPGAGPDPSLGALVHDLSTQVPGLLALLGKNQVTEATPAMPERAVEGIKEDIATVKGQHP